MPSTLFGLYEEAICNKDARIRRGVPSLTYYVLLFIGYLFVRLLHAFVSLYKESIKKGLCIVLKGSKCGFKLKRKRSQK